MSKIKKLKQLLLIVKRLKQDNKRIVFTNGCFDLIHPGHIRLLKDARSLGDVLIVGLNSDRSVRKIKGASRPIANQMERAEILAALEMVDYVVLFHQADPFELISTILPHILVKGGDWSEEEIVGRKVVEENGGKVLSLPIYGEYSTSKIINTILHRFSPGEDHNH